MTKSRWLTLACVLVAWPAAAQNAFFNRATTIPIFSVNLPQPASVAAADFNQDGVTDLAVGGQNTVVILFGQPNGEFVQSQSFSIQGQAAVIVAADFNQDGAVDLAVAVPEGPVIAVLQAAGAGLFQPPVLTALPFITSRAISMAAGDLDSDGKPDLVICYLSGDLVILGGSTGVSFRAGVLLHPGPPIVQNTQVLIADLNQDGRSDIVVGRSRVSTIGVYFGNGDGTFAGEQSFEVCRDPGTLLAADVDSDGVTDLAVGSLSNDGVWLLRGAGDGGFRSPVALPLGQGARGLALADWNGDGIPDLAASLLPGSVSIVYGTGGGAFSESKGYAAGVSPSWLAVGDFDGDGKPDLAVLNSGTQNISILLSQGGAELSAGPTIGSFRPTWLTPIPPLEGDTPVLAAINAGGDEALIIGLTKDGGAASLSRLRTGRDPSRMVVADFNQDGWPDLAISANFSATVSLFFGRSEGGYEPERRVDLPRPAQELAADDVNGDGTPDLIAGLGGPFGPAVLLNRGDGSFDLPLLVSNQSILVALVAADFTGDGFTDLAAADPGQGLVLFRGNGNATFQPGALVERRSGLAYLRAADLNGDGRLDIVSLEASGNLVAYLNTPDGLRSSLPLRIGEPSAGFTVADFNGDGHADVAVGLSNPRGVLVSFGVGDGSFLAGRLFQVDDAPLGVAALDVDRDGRPDLIVSTSRGIVILWNDAAPSPPPTPSVPHPIRPGANAPVLQNDPASACTPDPVRGAGFRIHFEWTMSSPAANLRGYELFAAARGAAQPLANIILPPTLFFDYSQCGYVPDVGLEGWEWRVRALAISPPDSDWSEAMAFRFLPCRFPDGRPCGVPPPDLPGPAPTGNLSVERARHTATLLADGRVLVAGGDNYNSGRVVELGSAELYDPKTGQFTLTGTLRTARSGHTATLLADGRVLLTGGVFFGPPPAQPVALASAEVYSPATGQFTAVGNMAQVRAGHAAVRLADGRVLITGGTVYPATSGFATAEIFNPATNTFVATGSLAFSRYFHTATLLPSGQVLIAGGVGPPNMSAELYDPSRGVFSATQPPVFQQLSHTATLIAGGQALLAGGWSGSGPTAAMQVFDSATGRFILVAPLTAPRQLHQATLLADGSVLFTGGASSNGLRLPVIDRFDPATRTVTSLPPMLAPRADHSATLLQDGRVLITGGTNGSNQGIGWWRTAETYSPPKPSGSSP